MSYHTPRRCLRNGCGAETGCDDYGGGGDGDADGGGGEDWSENVSDGGGGVSGGEYGVRYHEKSVSD